MRIEKCYFCSSSIYPGHGVVFVRNDCKVFRFCRAKCHKNFKLKRNPRKSKWTKAFRKSHGKEMAVDSTFEFERRRDTPVQYDRDLMTKTLRAMKRVQEIKSAREKRFYEARMRPNKAKDNARALVDLKTGIDLIISPLAREKEQILQTVASKVSEKESNPEEKGEPSAKKAAPKKKKKKATKKKEDTAAMSD